jgi:hypothetical protein
MQRERAAKARRKVRFLSDRAFTPRGLGPQPSASNRRPNGARPVCRTACGPRLSFHAKNLLITAKRGRVGECWNASCTATFCRFLTDIELRQLGSSRARWHRIARRAQARSRRGMGSLVRRQHPPQHGRRPQDESEPSCATAAMSERRTASPSTTCSSPGGHGAQSKGAIIRARRRASAAT